MAQTPSGAGLALAPRLPRSWRSSLARVLAGRWLMVEGARAASAVLEFSFLPPLPLLSLPTTDVARDV